MSPRSGGLSFTGPPSEWQQQAVRRLAYLAIIGVAVSVFALVVSVLRQDNVDLRVGLERPIWPMVVSLVMSVVMILACRSDQITPRLRLDMGLVYLVGISFLAAYFRHALPYYPSDVLRGQSPVVFCILFFCVLVPVRPVRMVIGAAAAALTDPLALGLMIAGGHPTPPWNLWLWLFLPNIVAVVIAGVSAHLLFQVGRAVTAAREMGAYRLVEPLGVGGMGEVWRAEHRTLARLAAIKLVRPEALGVADESLREVILRRFEREAQATARLTSPHTIDVFDFGISRDGSFYYVMELLHGMNLEELLEVCGQLPPARAVHFLEQVGQSLNDAHHAGIVHRDIKPANIYICRRGRQWDYVKVLDFGLVKQLDTEGTQLTVAGGIAGTPAYMSPEAARGREVGPPADIYALGCVGYRMLAGRDVFEGKGAVGLIFAHAQEVPQSLAELAPPDAPSSLIDLIMRCLAKDPENRPASAEAFLEGLAAAGISGKWTPADADSWWTAYQAPPRAVQESSDPTVDLHGSPDAVADTMAAADTLAGDEEPP